MHVTYLLCWVYFDTGSMFVRTVRLSVDCRAIDTVGRRAYLASEPIADHTIAYHVCLP